MKRPPTAGRLRPAEAGRERATAADRLRPAEAGRERAKAADRLRPVEAGRERATAADLLPPVEAGRERPDHERVGLQPDATAHAGRATFSPSVVWDALATIPDPEIPVISIVDLGVVRAVAVDGTQVRVDFTPTFMGCPALETMVRSIEAAIGALGGEADVRVRYDDSWSTDRISPEGRERLRAAGFAPPAPRSAGTPTLVQLQRGPFRCPYCGSTETRLENIFGPTPCRSLRYCTACRQPFEQFKTI